MATQPDTKLTRRLKALLAALRAGACDQPTLLQRLAASHAYPNTAHVARMVARDITYLAALGIHITQSTTRPPIYTLHGGTPTYTHDELRLLALIRDSFDPRHPQYEALHALLARLTANLTPAEHTHYTTRVALHIPMNPAIDYTPYRSLIQRLETAIATNHLLQFTYRATHGHERLHKQVEPLALEYYENHFYLVGYSYVVQHVFDYRIDRICDNTSLRLLHTIPPPMRHVREYITFRYRLAARLAQGEISQRFHNQRIIETLPNGDVIIEAEGRSPFFIRRTLLKYAANAELLAPAWLRAELAAEVAALAALYQP